MPKMRIFNRLDEIEFESTPKFNSAERKQFFTVSKAIWAHFNLHGEFDFSDEKMQDSIGLVSPKNSSSKTA